MEEAPENSKESSHSAHANGMNEGLFVTTIYETTEQVVSR
jgi:hypothetical protein